jgi:hypothetical protein
MNTFNLITAIALLACISTPAYVIYYLKYFIREKINTLEENLNDVDLEIANHDSHIAEINYERNKELIDFNNLIENVESQLKSVNNKTSNTFEQLHVDMNYVKRTLNDENAELKKSLQFVIERLESIEASHIHFKQTTSESIKYLKSEVDSLQSLNITTQNILKRINSKEFTTELVREWIITLNKEKKEKEERESLRSKSKVGRAIKDKQEEVKQTKPTESVVSDVVNIIKDQQQEPLFEQESSEDKKPRKTKKDSKRVIRNRELEIYFKKQTRLTYRGFVIKFGEEAFKREKQLVYKRLHYYKFVKQQQQNDYVQSEIAFKTKQ